MSIRGRNPSELSQSCLLWYISNEYFAYIRWCCLWKIRKPNLLWFVRCASTSALVVIVNAFSSNNRQSSANSSTEMRKVTASCSLLWCKSWDKPLQGATKRFSRAFLFSSSSRLNCYPCVSIQRFPANAVRLKPDALRLMHSCGLYVQKHSLLCSCKTELPILLSRSFALRMV